MYKQRKLSRAERKAIQAAISRAKQADDKTITAQDTIPYQRMLPNGICRVTDTLYSKTIQYRDINYQLSSNEDKQEIFDSWCDFVNYFDSSVGFQFSFCDLPAMSKMLGENLSIRPKGDDYDGIRREYTGML